MYTCRVRVVHVSGNQSRQSGTGRALRGGPQNGRRPAEPDPSAASTAAGPRPPPSGRAREARKNSTGEARTGVWSCSNCKLLRGRSRAEVPEDTGRLSEGHGDHTDWISCYGVNHYPIGGIVGVANLLEPVKRPRGEPVP
jgi:hypothetical protein